MTNELRNRIEDFITDWNHTVNDLDTLAEYDAWLETAISLLEESIGAKK